MDRIPTARPSWTEDMRNAAIETLDSRQWVKGAKGKEFGELFAAYCGAESAVPCQNGSSSLWAALKILNIGPGDEVIVPSYTFISTVTAISLVGATPVFVDVEEDYWCIDYHSIKNALTSKTKAVIAVHIYGQVYNPEIINLCKNNSIYLIEDAAQAHGASFVDSNGEEHKSGSLGDLGCFSFFPSKNMAVGGEGGMLTTTRKEFTTLIYGVINHGRSPSLESIQLGSNLRMSEVSAAIGIEQLKQLDKWVERRRNIANRYNEQFFNHSFLLTPKVRPNTRHAWHQYCLSTKYPSQLIEHLDQYAIDARRYYQIPCHKQQLFAEHSQHHEELPYTNQLAKSLVAIPVMHELTDFEIDRIIKAVKSFNPN